MGSKACVDSDRRLAKAQTKIPQNVTPEKRRARAITSLGKHKVGTKKEVYRHGD